MTTHSFIKKTSWLLALGGVFLFSGVIFFQLQTAFGWTNPLPGCTPPACNGALYYDSVNSRLGINTSQPADTLSVNGIINLWNPSSTLAHLIHGVATPVAGNDAVNKDYVDAQVATAGGGILTIFSIATSTTSAPANMVGSGITPGKGIQCPIGYGAAVTGFGPFGLVAGGGWASSNFKFLPRSYPSEPFEGSSDPSWQHMIDADAISPTYSVCSQSRYHIVPSDVPLTTWAPGQANYSYVNAKACSTYSTNAPPYQITDICNVCAICIKGYEGPVTAAGTVPPDTR
jgi:hypothetical protein